MEVRAEIMPQQTADELPSTSASGSTQPLVTAEDDLIISCPPPQDIPYYNMSMLREITFFQITYHSVSMLLLILQLIVCIILVVTIITIICPLLTGMAPQIMIYTGTVCPARVSYLSLVYHSMH